MKLFRGRFFPVLCLLLAAAGWKLVFLLRNAVPFNADEAVVALMARHILQGERPVFFYGQVYMGSLDAWLAAGGFALFGQQVWVIRLVQGLLYLGTILTTVYLGDAVFGSRRVGLLAGALLAVPVVNTTLYTTASLGGYGEALLIGNLALLASFTAVRRFNAGQSARIFFLLWGFLAGLGLWANGLTLVYSLPSGIYLAWSLFSQRGVVGRREQFVLAAVLLAGGLAAAAPWWLYALQVGPARLVSELFGAAVAVESQPFLARTAVHLVNFFTLGLTAALGLRPPWEVRWLAWPLLPLVLAFWLGAAAWTVRRVSLPLARRAELAVVCGVVLAVTLGFVFTSFGVDPSGRYFLPLAAPLALVGGGLILTVAKKLSHQLAITALLIFFQAWGTFQAAVYPPGLTTQFYAPSAIDHRYDGELIQFLRQQGETRGYSNYWVAYPLAFLSQEELIFVPALPYHLDLSYTSRDNRYGPYSAEVARSDRTAYIITRNPPLRAALRAEFNRLGVSWQEQKIGDFEIFYRLSRPVRPEELGFGPMG